MSKKKRIKYKCIVCGLSFKRATLKGSSVMSGIPKGRFTSVSFRLILVLN